MQTSLEGLLCKVVSSPIARCIRTKKLVPIESGETIFIIKHTQLSSVHAINFLYNNKIVTSAFGTLTSMLTYIDVKAHYDPAGKITWTVN